MGVPSMSLEYVLYRTKNPDKSYEDYLESIKRLNHAYTKQGYTDAFYGKDSRIDVVEEYREAYVEGQDKLHKEFEHGC